MLKWYSDLYIGDEAKKKSKKIIRKINIGSGQLGIYVITLANNTDNQLEIISSNLLLEKPIRKICPMIIGIAKGYEEALVLVTKITEEVYDKTGNANIRAFIEANASGV